MKTDKSKQRNDERARKKESLHSTLPLYCCLSTDRIHIGHSEFFLSPHTLTPAPNRVVAASAASARSARAPQSARPTARPPPPKRPRPATCSRRIRPPADYCARRADFCRREDFSCRRADFSGPRADFYGTNRPCWSASQCTCARARDTAGNSRSRAPD